MVLGITDVQQHKQQEYYDVTLLHNFFIFLLGTGELVRGGNFGSIFLCIPTVHVQFSKAAPSTKNRYHIHPTMCAFRQLKRSAIR